MAFPDGLLFDADDEGYVEVGRVPYAGKGLDEFVVAYCRAGTWVSSVTDRYRAYSHEDLAGGMGEGWSRADAIDAGWLCVSAYGEAGSLGGGSISTVAVTGKGLTRGRVEDAAGTLLDAGRIGWGWRVDAMPQGGDGWDFDGTVRELLARG